MVCHRVGFKVRHTFVLVKVRLRGQGMPYVYVPKKVHTSHETQTVCVLLSVCICVCFPCASCHLSPESVSLERSVPSVVQPGEYRHHLHLDVLNTHTRTGTHTHRHTFPFFSPFSVTLYLSDLFPVLRVFSWVSFLCRFPSFCLDCFTVSLICRTCCSFAAVHM